MTFPEPVVGAFILNNYGELLLLSSPKWNGLNVIPGGHIELKETIYDALTREVKEETGLELDNIKFLNIDEYIETKESGEVKHYIFLNFSGITSIRNITLNNETTEFKWVLPKEALDLKLTESTKKVIQTYLLS